MIVGFSRLARNSAIFRFTRTEMVPEVVENGVDELWSYNIGSHAIKIGWRSSTIALYFHLIKSKGLTR